MHYCGKQRSSLGPRPSPSSSRACSNVVITRYEGELDSAGLRARGGHTRIDCYDAANICFVYLLIQT